MTMPRVPACANIAAVAAPMPRDAPVIKATFPERSIMNLIAGGDGHFYFGAKAMCFVAWQQVSANGAQQGQRRRNDQRAAEAVGRDQRMQRLRRERADPPGT